MKDRDKKELKKIAQKIAQAEKELDYGISIEKNEKVIEELMTSLSMNDLAEVESLVSEIILTK